MRADARNAARAADLAAEARARQLEREEMAAERRLDREATAAANATTAAATASTAAAAQAAMMQGLQMIAQALAQRPSLTQPRHKTPKKGRAKANERHKEEVHEERNARAPLISLGTHTAPRAHTQARHPHAAELAYLHM